MLDLEKTRETINSLNESDAKSFLMLIAANMQMVRGENDGFTNENCVDALIKLFNRIPELNKEKNASWDPNPGCTHVHIVVGESFAGSMKNALKELGWSATHKLITMKENYAIGPLGSLDTPEGRKMRSDWFYDNITEALESRIQFEEEYNDLLFKLEQIPEQAEVIVWTSRSVREQIGIRHSLYLLRSKRNIIRLCDACAICEELFNRPDASIEYRHSGEIPPDKLQEVLKRMDSSGKLFSADLTRLAKEWLAISERGKTLRIWQDRTVHEVPADYYDQYMLEKLDYLRPPAGDNEFLRSPRLIGEVIGYCEQDIGDSYFEYRLRELIYGGILEIKGIPAGMRFYSIRRKRRAEK